MEYQEKDFDLCCINPLHVEDVRGYFKFKRHPEFSKISNDILRYIILYYDKNSPLQKIEDVREAKVQAALLAGFKLRNNKFADNVVTIMNCQDESVNNAIVRFTTFFYDNEYEDLITLKELRVLDRKKMLNNTDDVTKKEAIENMDRTRKAMEALQLTISNRDKSILLMKEMLSYIEDTEMPTPEYIANKLFNGVDIVKEYDEL